MHKKMDFFANMGISKNVMLHYRNMDAGIHRVRKTYQVINDITEEMEVLLRRWGVQGEFQVINNGYIKTNRSTMKIGKFMGKILSESQFKDFNSRYSDLLSKAKQTGTLILSNKLSDCLCASNYTQGWGSCQAFDYGNDCRGSANLIYYLSSNTYIAVVENDDGVKIFRQWIHMGNLVDNTTGIEKRTENIGIVFGRPYPGPNKMLENYIRQTFMEDIMKIPIHLKRVMEGKYYNLLCYNLKDISEIPYKDIEYRTTTIALPKENANLIPAIDEAKFGPRNFYIEVPLGDLAERIQLKCLFCGNEIYSITDFYGNGSCGCESRSGYACSSCGEGLEEGEVWWGDETPYCRDCYDEHYAYCPCCGNYYSNEDVREGDDGEWYCESCWEGLFFRCNGCEETTNMKNASTFEGDYYCADCYVNLFAECNECGEVFMKEDLNDQDCCRECANELENAEVEND